MTGDVIPNTTRTTMPADRGEPEVGVTDGVGHPPRFSISSAFERLSRSQASWTASSASLTEPSIR
jgi:hypothetical protein